MEAKSPLVEENGVYVISRFRVSNAKRSFRPVASQVMVEFMFRTQVSAAREDVTGFPAYTYRLTPIDHLKSCAGDTKDFVGKFLSCLLPMHLFYTASALRYNVCRCYWDANRSI